MRFSDITRFVTKGSWEIPYSVGDAVIQIENWKIEEGLDICPDFQRGHVWGEVQQVEYLEYLFKGGEMNRVIYFNCPGWNNSSDKGNMYCVDGLQRLTAIQKFVNNEIKVFGFYYNEFEDSPRMMQGIKFNVNDLATKKEVMEWYIQMNEGGTPHTKEELNRVKEMIKVCKD